MTLVEQVKAWLQTFPELAGFRFSLGEWTEQPGRVCAIWQDGGRVLAAERYPVIRIVLGGERETRTDALPLMDAAEAITAAAPDACIGEAARVTPISGIVGPGYTAEGRAWVEFNLELLI